MGGRTDGRTDGLAVELPIKFKFFTIGYGTKSLYVSGKTNEPFANISLCIRAVVRASVGHFLFFFFFKWEGWSFYCPTGRAS